MKDLAATWVRDLPRPMVHALADALLEGPAALIALQSTISGGSSSHAVLHALKISKQGEGPYVAGLMHGRLAAMTEAPTLTPVWTGPSSAQPGKRLTIAVVADLVSEAMHELLLVSYAAYPPASLRTALDAAGDRGVLVTTLLESPLDRPGFTGPPDPFPGLTGQRLRWPAADRPPHASMHAKLLVVDRRVALIGSANLTEAALERNLECGVLIRGGEVPGLLADLVRGSLGA